MKSFYSEEVAITPSLVPALPASAEPESMYRAYRSMCARVAVYESPGSAPRVEAVEPAPVPEFIESLAARVYELAREQGGSVPYTAIREVTENFIHADFAEPVVSILDSGATIRFADQGPGIADKERAVLPGFTTACGDMKRYIRGVGSGLPIVKDYLSFSGGTLMIEDNLGGGSVVTLCARSTAADSSASSVRFSLRHQDTPMASQSLVDSAARPSSPRLSTRQKQVLALVMESGAAGPSLVAKELGVGVSTAYRDLASLEEMDLICSDGGKRTLTERGLACLDRLVTG